MNLAKFNIKPISNFFLCQVLTSDFFAQQVFAAQVSKWKVFFDQIIVGRNQFSSIHFCFFLDIQSWYEVPSIAHFCSLFRAAFSLVDFDIEVLISLNYF